MLSYPGRTEMRKRTIADLAATDWGDAVVIELVREVTGNVEDRIVRGALRMLRRALADESDLILFLEDDLRFNRYLRFNVEHWTPFGEVTPDEHFFASLYNPGVCFLERSEESSYCLVDARCVYGSQALLLSRATARYVVAHWDEEGGFQDNRMARLAARLGRIYYHVPSLIQHVGLVSGWGGPYHRAADFQPDWRGAVAACN
jgi:hypothetical protein